jgi:hypothetical protein
MEESEMGLFSRKVRKVYSFIIATTMLDVSNPIGNTIVKQIYPYACENLRNSKPEFKKLYDNVKKEHTENLIDSGMTLSSKDFASCFNSWLKTQGMFVDNFSSLVDKQAFVFAGDAQNPQDGSKFSWSVFIYFDIA